MNAIVNQCLYTHHYLSPNFSSSVLPLQEVFNALSNGTFNEMIEMREA